MIEKLLNRGESEKTDVRRLNKTVRELREENSQLKSSLKEAQRKRRHAKDRLKRERKNMEEEKEKFKEGILKKAKRKGSELAREKAEEIIEKREQELEEKDRIRRRAAFQEIEERVQEGIEKERRKVRKVIELVIDDSELLEILEDGSLNKERFNVILEASEKPELARKLKRAHELGDVETIIQVMAEELEEEETPPGEDLGEKPVEEPEEETSEGFVEMVSEDQAEEETEPKEQSGSNWKVQVEEDLDNISFDVLRALASGYTSASEIGDFIGKSNRTVKDRYAKLKQYDLIVTGTTGATLTNRGGEILDWIDSGESVGK